MPVRKGEQKKRQTGRNAPVQEIPHRGCPKESSITPEPAHLRPSKEFWEIYALCRGRGGKEKQSGLLSRKFGVASYPTSTVTVSNDVVA